jgi:acyl-CoA thioester hydrolase
MDFTVTLTPRFYETDALGHINNAAIAAWFEVVRIRWLDSLLEESSGVDRNWVLAAISLDFVAETFYGSDVCARVTSARAGNSSLTVACEMTQNNQLTVRGEAVLVHLDLNSKQKLRIPDSLRDQLGNAR